MTVPSATSRTNESATLDETDARSEVRRLLGRALEAVDEWEPWEVEPALEDAAKIAATWRYIARHREALVR